MFEASKNNQSNLSQLFSCLNLCLPNPSQPHGLAIFNTVVIPLQIKVDIIWYQRQPPWLSMPTLSWKSSTPQSNLSLTNSRFVYAWDQGSKVKEGSNGFSDKHGKHGSNIITAAWSRRSNGGLQEAIEAHEEQQAAVTRHPDAEATDADRGMT